MGTASRWWSARPRRLVAALALALGLAPLGVLAQPGTASASTGTSVTINTSLSATYWSSADIGVTVTANSGPNPTSGTVVVTDSFGGIDCTLQLSGSNSTACDGTYEAVGNDTVSASYEANGSYGASTNTATVDVSQASVTLSANASAATVGQTTTVTVQMTPTPENTAGTLTISDSAHALDCAINTATSALQCTSSAFTSVVSDSIAASWTGNADYNPESAATTLDVTQASTVVSSVTAAPSSVGETATITVQVEPHPDAGDVSVSDADGEVSGCGDLAVNPSSGEATCTTPTLTHAEVADTLSAQYLGDANYEESAVNDSSSLAIEPGESELTITADPGPAVGSTATYVATLTPAAAGEQGGTVAFSDTDPPVKVTDCNSQPVNTSNGTASCQSLAYSAVGTDTVSASWAGDSNWAASSNQQTFSIAQGSPMVTVSLSPAQPSVGESVTVTAVVSPSDGGGTVDFSGSYLSGCSAVPLSGDAARCTSSTLSATGHWTITATYSGDTNYDSSFSGSTVTITAAATTVTLASNPTNPEAFSAATLTATVSPVPDGGTVSFSGSGGVIAGCSTVAVSTVTGVASCPVASLPGAGVDNLAAAYSGDTDYQSSSGQLALGIAKIATTVSVSPSPDPVTAGEDTTLTISVAPPPDGGTVTVTDSFGDLRCSNLAVPTSGPDAGSTTCVTGALSPAGTDLLSGSFSGTSNYTSAGGTGAISVERVPSTVDVTSADSFGVVAGQLHLSVTVSPLPVDGTVEFSDDLAQLGACASVPVDPSTGVASCTSGTLTKTGPDTITATFEQTATEASSSVSTTIPIDEQPSFTGPLSFTATVGTPASGALGVDGYPAPSVTAGAPLPSGLSLNPNGTITGTAAPGTGGSYSIPVTATNSLSSASGTLNLVVDQIPSITSATSLSAAYGTDTTFQITTAAGTYPTPSISLSGAVPDGMTFTDNGDGTATISGTPNDYVSGSQSFALYVSNAAGSVRVPYTIDITGTPPVPTTSVPPTTEAPPSSTSSGTALSPVGEALALRREMAVPSGGREPKVTGRGALPVTYDPIAPTETVRRDGKAVKVPFVTLGNDLQFPALGNVGPYGDCAVVADSNIVRVDHLAGRIAHVPRMTVNEALSEWSAINGGTGSGLTDSQLLHAWASPAGLLGTRIRGWARLDPQHLVAMKRAILASGAVYGTIVLPESTPLETTIDPAITSNTEVAGHALAVFGWTKHGFLVVTWGEVALIPYGWWSKYAATGYALNIVDSAPSKTAK